MALGFGFNKAKVLGSAEKFVQQGRLPNAIAEYLKVLQEDPKDLTVMNTVGDLYARLGQNDEAIQYFKRVGEAYAGDGFIVKAIAIYKKLCKLNPSAMDTVVKLAEMYAQQGLYNDARAQYLIVADRALRAGDHEQAARTFQKMLELDPENAAIQAKLADLYVKIGNHAEAGSIFFGAAEALFRRGAVDAADEALGRVLKLNPAHTEALMLRGQIAAEAGKPEHAVQYLEKVPNLDSQPDALRALLRSYLQLNRGTDAIPVATKLVAVHNDLSGITLVADWQVSSGDCAAGLRLYEQYADRLLAGDRDAMVEKVSAMVVRVNQEPAALELILKLYRKAGDTAHLNEVIELLAHALVQAGELVRARDLYKELADLEPENPLHAQNYKQVTAKLGDDATTRPLTPAEGSQALMVDELELHAPVVDQNYPEELTRSVRAALTDSELLDSYNLPSKAIAPLEAVLPAAPRDVLLNQRLASLYVRAERYSDAARCCDILRSVYAKAGHNELATQYGEMGAKYHERAGESAPQYVPEAPEPAVKAEPPPTPELDVTPREEAPALDLDGGTGTQETVHAVELNDWEQMIAIEPPSALAHSDSPETASAPARSSGDVVGDLLEEIHFYISQAMLDEAEVALERCSTLAPGIPELDELRREIGKARSAGAPLPEVEVVEDGTDAGISTLVFDGSALDEADTAAQPHEVAAPLEIPPVPPPPMAPPPIAANTPVAKAAPLPKAADTPPRVIKPAPGRPAVEVPPPVPKPFPPAVPTIEPPPAAQSVGELHDMLLELEQALGSDFALDIPSPPKRPAQPPPVVPERAVRRPAPAPDPSPTPAPKAAPPSRPVPPEPMRVPVVPAAAAKIVFAPPAGGNGNQASTSLSDIFEEFREDVEGQAATPQEDPETHYNLGVAFREMGLLDEAIGELQKVCQAVDSGFAFPHTLQVYTWLAECLAQKGAPQASIMWYQRALKLPAIDSDMRLALHYEMAAAYEAAGNRQAALDNFMEVYAHNIDYRDVAERIKTLKA